MIQRKGIADPGSNPGASTKLTGAYLVSTGCPARCGGNAEGDYRGQLYRSNSANHKGQE